MGPAHRQQGCQAAAAQWCCLTATATVKPATATTWFETATHLDIWIERQMSGKQRWRSHQADPEDVKSNPSRCWVDDRGRLLHLYVLRFLRSGKFTCKTLPKTDRHLTYDCALVVSRYHLISTIYHSIRVRPNEPFELRLLRDSDSIDHRPFVRSWFDRDL
jgi:hypothetical protein